MATTPDPILTARADVVRAQIEQFARNLIEYELILARLQAVPVDLRLDDWAQQVRGVLANRAVALASLEATRQALPAVEAGEAIVDVDALAAEAAEPAAPAADES